MFQIHELTDDEAIDFFDITADNREQMTSVTICQSGRRIRVTVMASELTLSRPFQAIDITTLLHYTNWSPTWFFVADVVILRHSDGRQRILKNRYGRTT